MKALSTLIVEDQASIRHDIRCILARSGRVDDIRESDSIFATQDILKNSQPDLALLDIHLKDGTAFDLLRSIAPFNFKIIFLTAFEKYAIQAIKFGALDYILKPIDEEELLQALNKVGCLMPVAAEQINVANQHHLNEGQNRLALRTPDYLQIIDIRDILFCHSDAGYTSFHLCDGRKFVVSKILKDYEDILCEPQFIRPHASYIVNFRYIERYYNSGHFILNDGTEIPVATRRKDSVKEFFNRL